MSVPAASQFDGRVDFRALVEANWERVEASTTVARAETPMSVGTSRDGLDAAAREEERERWESDREQKLAKAETRRKDSERRFVDVKRMFEDGSGHILDYYFARTVKDAGAALTARRVGARSVLSLLYLRSSDVPEVELHAYNLVLFDLPDEPAFVSLRVRFAELLHRIDARHTSAHFMLRGLSRHVLILRLFALRRDMLADLDKARGELGYPSDGAASASSRTDDDTSSRADDDRFSARAAVGARLGQSLSGYEAEFQSIARTYRQAAKREARIIYLGGMLRGLVLLALFSPVLALVLAVTDVPINLDTFFTCFAAGAVGAFVSVLQRMSAGKFTVNHEVGREYVQRLAYFRPFIGSIFGLAVLFALEAGVANVQPPSDGTERYSFFAFFAFLAGFSERFAKEVLGSPSGADTEESDLLDSSDVGSAAKRFAELSGAGGDQEVVVETTRATSQPAGSEAKEG